VENVLRQLGIEPHDGLQDKRVLIEVWNKLDRLNADERERLKNLAERRPADERPVLVSALTGEGIAALSAAVEDRLAAGRVLLELVLGTADGAGVSWLHRHTEVINKTIDQTSGRVTMTVRVEPEKARAVREKFAEGVADEGASPRF
jgi:GTP-binding protein HflX